jgi:hypothetical protein
MFLAIKGANRYVAIRLLIRYGGYDAPRACAMRNFELAAAIRACVLSGVILRKDVKEFETQTASNKPRLRFDGSQWVLVSAGGQGRGI